MLQSDIVKCARYSLVWQERRRKWNEDALIQARSNASDRNERFLPSYEFSNIIAQNSDKIKEEESIGAVVLNL
jgi:hypothetical protein